jgi:hypothetical protein
MQNTGFFVDNAIKTIVIMIFVNFANKSILILEIQKMTINGSDVINATDG